MSKFVSGRRSIIAINKSRIKSLLMAVLVAVTTIAVPRASLFAAEMLGPSDTPTSPSLYLLDVATGRILFERQSELRRPVASTTKIMTALLVLERSNPEDTVTISPRAASTAGATIGLLPGERRQVKELLHALMLASANDAAIALAEHVGGSVAKFAQLMNERATQAGARNTHFISPHGLSPGRDHYSTAEDLAKIATTAFKRRDFRMLAGTRRYSWAPSNGGLPVQISNSNHLLQEYSLATGIKTGFTAESGYCLVASGEDGGRSAIAVVLGSSSREQSFADAKSLLSWALKDFELKPVVKRARRYGSVKISGKTIPLVAARTLVDLAYTGKRESPGWRFKKRAGLKLPVAKGDWLGNMLVAQDGQSSRSVRMLAGRSAASPYITHNLNGYFWRVVKKMENLF